MSHSASTARTGGNDYTTATQNQHHHTIAYSKLPSLTADAEQQDSVLNASVSCCPAPPVSPASLQGTLRKTRSMKREEARYEILRRQRDSGVGRQNSVASSSQFFAHLSSRTESGIEPLYSPLDTGTNGSGCGSGNLSTAQGTTTLRMSGHRRKSEDHHSNSTSSVHPQSHQQQRLDETIPVQQHLLPHHFLLAQEPLQELTTTAATGTTPGSLSSAEFLMNHSKLMSRQLLGGTDESGHQWQSLQQPMKEYTSTMITATAAAGRMNPLLGRHEASPTDHDFQKTRYTSLHGMKTDPTSIMDLTQNTTKQPSIPLHQLFLEQPLISLLFFFIPLGFISYGLQWPDYLTFCLNFVGIVPQAWLMGKATEDLAGHMGQVTGGLLNAWFGNVVEMLLCIAGLRAGELLVVKATLVGSMLSNLLLVTGCSFLFGGFKHKVQEFSAIGASTNASLMTLSCLCLGLPTMYGTITTSELSSELNISRSVSFFLIFMYIQYLIFQLGTHSFLFDDDEEEEEPALLPLSSAVLILALSTVVCTFSSEFLVCSIKGTVECWGISKSFIGIILLPIIGNAAENYTSVIVAMRNKMDLALACAVGSSCQMALFVTPFTVLVGWLLGQPMSLDLQPFEMTVLFLSVLIVTRVRYQPRLFIESLILGH